MCLHSAPRAGSWILLNVTGHLRLTLTPVCCTLSSELLANHLFTGEEGGGGRTTLGVLYIYMQNCVATV